MANALSISDFSVVQYPVDDHIDVSNIDSAVTVHIVVVNVVAVHDRVDQDIDVGDVHTAVGIDVTG